MFFIRCYCSTCFTLYISVHLQVWLTFPPKWIPSPFFIWYNALMSFPQTCRRLPSRSIIHLKNLNIFPSFVPGDIIPRFRVSLFAVCSTSVAGRSHPLRQGNEGVEPHVSRAVYPSFCCMNIVVHKEYQLFRFLFYD